MKDLPPAPVYLAALGPQMLRLAGETADGALLNWATPERIAVSRARIDEGAARAGRDPGAVPVTMYIRVCIDDDVAAARQALGSQVLGYALGQPGVPQDAGYRGLFALMGFDEVLRELEARRDRGAPLSELTGAVPEQMLQAVGYYGPAAGAPAAFARLSAGLDEAIVRVITARPGLEPVIGAMAALTPGPHPGRRRRSRLTATQIRSPLTREPGGISLTREPGDQIEDAERVVFIVDLCTESPAGHRPGENLPSGRPAMSSSPASPASMARSGPRSPLRTAPSIAASKAAARGSR